MTTRPCPSSRGRIIKKKNHADTPEVATRNTSRRDWVDRSSDDDRLGRDSVLRDLHRASRRITDEINADPNEARCLGRARRQARERDLHEDIGPEAMSDSTSRKETP